MHARKIRYDDSFIAEEQQIDAVEAVRDNDASSLSASYVPSPARQLQQQLEEQFSASATVKPSKKYSGLTSLSIIIASCSILWLSMITLGLFAFQ